MIWLIALLINACAPNDSAPSPNQSNAPRSEQAANNQNSNALPNSSLANNQNATAQPTQRSLGDPIDTWEYDAKIKNLEAKLKRKPADKNLKKELSQAYAARADALTDARQYRSALGDYRRALRNDEANAHAKEGADLITGIYVSMNLEAPAEGTEPPPLPFKQDNTRSENANGNAPRLAAPPTNLPAN